MDDRDQMRTPVPCLPGTQIKRRSEVVRIFPDLESVLRLASALLKEWHEDSVTGRR